jgi:uncharacterized membrane protein HdeD (DUF308 family)
MPDRRAIWQLLLSAVIAALAIIIAIPAWQRVPAEYALPLLLAGALIGMSVMRAELALRRRR